MARTKSSPPIENRRGPKPVPVGVDPVQYRAERNAKIIAASKAGKSYPEIAEEFDLTVSMIKIVMKNAKNGGRQSKAK